MEVMFGVVTALQVGMGQLEGERRACPQELMGQARPALHLLPRHALQSHKSLTVFQLLPPYLDFTSPPRWFCPPSPSWPFLTTQSEDTPSFLRCPPDFCPLCATLYSAISHPTWWQVPRHPAKKWVFLPFPAGDFMAVITDLYLSTSFTGGLPPIPPKQ